MIKRYNEFITERYQQTNEGLKDWVTSFMLLANVGLVPLSVTTANAQTKKDFVESQPQDKLDAARFVDYINKYGKGQEMSIIWDEFISKNSDVKSDLNQVQKYISKDGKNYNFDKKYQKRDFKNVDIHKFTPVNYLTDMGDFIEDSKEPSINNFIYEYEKQTSVEVCIITVNNLNDMDIFDYAVEQFDRIGIGKEASDNGLLMIFSMEDRKWGIYPGRGLEGVLPDYTCNQIGEDIVVPEFKKGDYYTGIMNALKQVKLEVDKNPEDIKKFKEEQSAKDWEATKEVLTNIGYGLLSLIALIIIFKLFKRKWDEAVDLNQDVNELISDLDKIIRIVKSNGLTNIEEVDELYNKVKSLIEGKSKDIDKAKKSSEVPKYYQVTKHYDFIMNQKNKKSLLENLLPVLAGSFNSWVRKKQQLDRVLGDLNSLDVDYIIRSIDAASNAVKKLEAEYGVEYDFDEKSLKSFESKLEDIISKVESEYKVSLDSAERLIKSFKSISDSIDSKVISATGIYGDYSSAESYVKDFDKHIEYAVSSAEKYKKWAKSGETDKAKELMISFKDLVSGGVDRHNIMMYKSALDEVIDEWSNIKSKWSSRKRKEEDDARRKREEEEEEERRRRRSSYSSGSSYGSSYGSSSGGSSFGGFGGGSFGGGGASGGW